MALFYHFINDLNYDEEYLLKSVSKYSHEAIWYFINPGMNESWIEYPLHSSFTVVMCTLS